MDCWDGYWLEMNSMLLPTILQDSLVCNLVVPLGHNLCLVLGCQPLDYYKKLYSVSSFLSYSSPFLWIEQQTFYLDNSHSNPPWNPNPWLFTTFWKVQSVMLHNDVIYFVWQFLSRSSLKFQFSSLFSATRVLLLKPVCLQHYICLSDIRSFMVSYYSMIGIWYSYIIGFSWSALYKLSPTVGSNVMALLYPLILKVIQLHFYCTWNFSNDSLQISSPLRSLSPSPNQSITKRDSTDHEFKHLVCHKTQALFIPVDH